MTFRSTVTIVASPRSRVGKTLLARLLVDYHRQENRSVQAFDLNTGENTLAQFLPGEVTAAGVGSFSADLTAVPEPGSVALMGIGCVLVVGARLRKGRKLA